MSNKGKGPDDIEFNTIVGKNIKYLRKLKRLTQTQVGNAINVSFQQIQKYEKGANGLHSFALHKVAHKVFNMTMDQLTDPNLIKNHENRKDEYEINLLLAEEDNKQEAIVWIKKNLSKAKEIIGIAQSEKPSIIMAREHQTVDTGDAVWDRDKLYPTTKVPNKITTPEELLGIAKRNLVE